MMERSRSSRRRKKKKTTTSGEHNPLNGRALGENTDTFFVS
jgi:hypothetical protein